MASRSQAEASEDIPGLADLEYGDLHRIVLQGIMAAGFLDITGVKSVFQSACKFLRYTPEDAQNALKMPYVQKVVRMINDEIKPYNMQIRSASCELHMKNGKEQKYFIFLVTSENPIAKMQTMFTNWEVEIFQRCMDGILRRYPNFALPMSECINVVKDIDARVSVSQSEKFVLKMIDLLYFTKLFDPEDGENDDFDVTIGVRTLREFEPLLTEFYRDVVRVCSYCQMILLHGYRCPRCRILFHKPCNRKYLLKASDCSCGQSLKDESVLIVRSRDRDEEDEQITAQAVALRSSVYPSTSTARVSTSSSSQLAIMAAPTNGYDQPSYTPSNSFQELEGVRNAATERAPIQEPVKKTAARRRRRY